MRLLVLSAFALLVGAGCSLVIDLPADCDDDACGAYVCAPDGIACLDACAGDDDCGAGHLCDPLTAQCEASACRLSGEVTTVALPDEIAELAMSWATPAQAGEQFVTLVGQRGGFGLRRFDAAGRPGGDPVGDSGLFDIRTANPSRRRFQPSATWYDAGTVNDVGAAFASSWVDVSETPDRIFVTTFPFAPAVEAPSHVEAVSVSRSVELLESDFAASGARGVLVWHQRSSASGDNVFVASTDPRGAVRGESVQLNDEDRPADGAVAARAGDSLVVAWSQNDAGMLRVRLAAIGGDAVPTATVDIDPGTVEAQTTRIDRLELHDGTDGVSLTWVLRTSTEASWRAAWVSNDELAGAGTSNLSLPSVAVTAPMPEPDAVFVTARADELWWVFAGRADGRDALWLQRTARDGTALDDAAAFADNPGGLGRGALRTTSDGAALVAVSASDAGDVTRLWRVTCGDE